MKRSVPLCFAWALAFTPLVWADEKSEILVANLIQNEIQDLPADHSALFTAAREVAIELEIPSQADLVGLEDALVTVIRPSGETTEIRPDANGLVMIDNVEKGPHALVVAGREAHGAKLFYFDEQREDAVGQGLEQAAEPARMTLLEIDAKELRPLINRVRGVSASIDDIVASVEFDVEFGYRVALGADGTLDGQLFTVAMDRDNVNFEGTRVAIYSDGVLVAATRSDASGRFQVTQVQPGVHGVVAAGPPGYAAFAFEAVAANAVALKNTNGETFVSQLEAVAEKLPVVLIPPAFCPSVVDAMDEYYPSLEGPAGVDLPPPATTGTPMGVPVGGSMISPSPGFGGGGGGGGFGAGSGFEGIGALVGIGVIAAASGDGNGAVILPSPPASPSIP